MSETAVKFRATRRQRIATAIGGFALALFVVGLAVRLSVRDRVLIANTIYYATPWSVLCVLGCIAAWRLKTQRARRPVTVSLTIAALACGASWAATALSFRGTAVEPGDVRILCWNLAHGKLGLSGLAAAAAQLEPDVALFVEADPSGADVRQIFKAAFPERHVVMLGGGIVLVSRWPGGEARAYQLGTKTIESRIREIELETPWGQWTVFGCDIASDTLYQREPHFRELAARIARRSNPVIIAGDFNTPLDSIHLDLLRTLGLHEAFETAGSGYLPTWPVPCPVLSLDQIWLDGRLQPIDCERRWNWRTDHAAVIATIRPAP